MGHGVLFRRRKFRGRQVPVADKEIGIVAKAAVAARRVDDPAVPFAFGDDGLRIVGMADEDEDANVMGAPVGLAGQIGGQFRVVAVVGFRFPGIARGMDPRLAAESMDA